MSRLSLSCWAVKSHPLELDSKGGKQVENEAEIWETSEGSRREIENQTPFARPKDPTAAKLEGRRKMGSYKKHLDKRYRLVNSRMSSD